jgi:hypothetical protein
MNAKARVEVEDEPRESWWADPALQSDRLKFAQAVREHQPSIERGKFGPKYIGSMTLGQSFDRPRKKISEAVL